MATQKVNIDIQTKGAKKSKDELSGLTGAINKVGKAAGIASAAYFGAKGLIGAFSSVIEASARQEQAEKALEVALGRTSTALLNQASALQQVTTAGDEALIEQQAFLASLKFTEDQIKTIIPVALDLSAATGISLESAVRNTAKTFSGLAGELGELVPQLRELTQEEMKAGDAVKVLAELFEGQASKQAETMAGALIQASNSAGDLSEAIGAKLSPLVTKLALGFTDTASSLTELLNLTGQTKSETLIYYETVERAEEVLKKYSDSLGITTDESLSLSDQILQLREEAEKINDNEFFKGVAFSEAAKGLRDTRGLVEELDVALQNFRATALPDDRPIHIVDPHEPELLDDVILDMGEMNDIMNESFGINEAIKKQKQDLIIQDLKNAALQQSSAKDAMKAVIRAETMEAVAGYIASVLKSVPFPANLVLAAGGGAIASGLIDKGLSSFATGGDFVTSGPQMIMVGDNPGGRERVQVSPLSSPNINGPSGGGVTVNIQGGIVDQSFVSNELIPAINKATSLGTKLNA